MCVALIYIRQEDNYTTRRSITMYTTADERGILNNYATEPELSYASYPSPEQQRRYLFYGAIATLLITASFKARSRIEWLDSTFFYVGK